MNIEQFAKKVEKEQRETLLKRFPDYPFPDQYNTKIVEGKKYTKVDVGNSGKFMIDEDGNIYGIKGYGQINKKKWYGTLDTTDQYYWGEYHPIKLI
jgi:hypothetical protein